MPDGNGEAFSRRDLLSLIGTVAGSAAMYQAMTSLGFAADSAYQGPIALDGDVQRRFRPDPRRRFGRHDGGAGAAQGRLQGSGPGIQWPCRAAATGPCAAATFLPSSAASRRPANSSKAFISTRGRGGFPIITARCSITASASTSRSSRSSSSITMRCCTLRTRSADSRSAFARSRPIFRARSPSCWPR